MPGRADSAAQIAALVGSPEADARARLEALREPLAEFKEPDLNRMLETYLAELASER